MKGSLNLKMRICAVFGICREKDEKGVKQDKFMCLLRRSKTEFWACRFLSLINFGRGQICVLLINFSATVRLLLGLWTYHDSSLHQVSSKQSLLSPNWLWKNPCVLSHG